MDPFTKIIVNHDLYNATEEEIIELENSIDPVVQKDTRKIFRPLFDDIQREKSEASEYTGELINRVAEKKDFDGIIRLSRRVNWTDDRTGIRSFSTADLNCTINKGIMFVATTHSGYIVGVSSILVGDLEGKKCGYEFTTMVSRLFRRKMIAARLFNKIIDWAQKNSLTHINTRHLSEDGFGFLKAIEQKRKDLKFLLNRFAKSSIIIENRYASEVGTIDRSRVRHKHFMEFIETC